MSVLARLVVKLSAESAEFQSNLQKAAKDSKSFEQQASESFKKAAVAAAAMGAAVAAATAVIVKNNLQSIDTLAKTSDRLGITTQKLAGLRHAAELTGAGAEAMDKGLRGMNMRLGQASAGLGEAKKWIDNLGLSADQLLQMAPDQAFERIADKIKGLGTQSEKTAAAAAIFGEEGIRLINTMELGAGGLREAAKEAEHLGMTLTRVDAAKVEAANDSMARAKGAIGGMGQTLAVNLAPYIEAAANALVRIAKESGGFKTQITAAVRGALVGSARLADVWHGWKLIFAGLKVAFAGLGMFIMRGLEQWDRALTDTINAATEAINVLIRGMNKIPGVEIPQLDAAQYSQDLQHLTTAAEEYFAEVNKEFWDLANKPLPSDQIKAWLAEVEAAAQVAAEKVAAAAPGGRETFAPTLGAAEETPDQTAVREKLALQLQALEESLMAEDERLQLAYERRAEMVRGAYEQELIGAEQQKILLEKLEADHMAKLAKIREKGLTDIQKFQAKNWKGQVQQVVGHLEDMTSSAATSNKTMFRINKMAAIANAVINTALGVSKTLSAYPMPLAAVMAAVHLAAGIAQVSAISSASFDGGGASVAPSVSASGATQVVQDAERLGDTTKTEQAPIINYYIYGSLVDHDGLARETHEAHQRAANDGQGRY